MFSVTVHCVSSGGVEHLSGEQYDEVAVNDVTKAYESNSNVKIRYHRKLQESDSSDSRDSSDSTANEFPPPSPSRRLSPLSVLEGRNHGDVGDVGDGICDKCNPKHPSGGCACDFNCDCSPTPSPPPSNSPPVFLNSSNSSSTTITRSSSSQRGTPRGAAATAAVTVAAAFAQSFIPDVTQFVISWTDKVGFDLDWVGRTRMIAQIEQQARIIYGNGVNIAVWNMHVPVYETFNKLVESGWVKMGNGGGFRFVVFRGSGILQNNGGRGFENWRVSGNLRQDDNVMTFFDTEIPAQQVHYGVFASQRLHLNITL